MASEVFFTFKTWWRTYFFQLASIACVQNHEKSVKSLCHLPMCKVRSLPYCCSVPLDPRKINAWIAINLSSTDFPQPIVFQEKKSTLFGKVSRMSSAVPTFFMYKYLESYDLKSTSSQKIITRRRFLLSETYRGKFKHEPIISRYWTRKIGYRKLFSRA